MTYGACLESVHSFFWNLFLCWQPECNFWLTKLMESEHKVTGMTQQFVYDDIPYQDMKTWHDCSVKLIKSNPKTLKGTSRGLINFYNFLRNLHEHITFHFEQVVEFLEIQYNFLKQLTNKTLCCYFKIEGLKTYHPVISLVNCNTADPLPNLWTSTRFIFLWLNDMNCLTVTSPCIYMQLPCRLKHWAFLTCNILQKNMW